MTDRPLTYEEQQQNGQLDWSMSLEATAEWGRTIQRERIVAPIISTGVGLLGIGIYCGILYLLDKSQPKEQEIEQPLTEEERAYWSQRPLTWEEQKNLDLL